MTPNEAAKACMAKLDEYWCGGMTAFLGGAALEREFTEIISQVTPRSLLHRLDEIAEREMAQSTANAFGLDDPANRGRLNGLIFPQEIVEPQPKSWWKRWLR